MSETKVELFLNDKYLFGTLMLESDAELSSTNSNLVQLARKELLTKFQISNEKEFTLK